MDTLANNYQQILAEITASEEKHGRAKGSVQLVAVSKTKPITAIETLNDIGQKHFGENYLQEAIEKISTLAARDISWHFIGSIQSNKTAVIAENFDWVHGVDRLKIAQRLSRQRPIEKGPLRIFLQVNFENETTKSGFTKTELLASLEEINTLPNLIVEGLMAIPKAHSEATLQRQVFKEIADANKQCQQTINTMTHLSMGMTNDMDSAIAEGATHVRVGTAIFGARDYN